jgi:hypothetical protein
MNLNTTQKIIIWIAVIVIALMIIYPPWIQKTERVEKFLGYSLLTSPPAANFYTLDYKRILLQLSGVIIITLALVVTLKDK